ncbi:DUF4148 domain-containing protein [Paraburkholderia sp. SARCC-3016]|jgi:hypothetical protein|uniref:DUF4148 domain-containing protein n=1 Tax=Paraburkholderia sp. SARCC-3016 TaxID=3058611 RepID=UPI002808896E|nr:DUF4148 domain-containing protein [Paraburkholderia sp. SARCC-3016]MDQ7978653.1 DUF4148 domain-containing protein [Paraburkholderia sp. SARCC-3016]
MKNIRLAAVCASALVFVSFGAHAQSSRVTRAQVNAELAQLSAAGYNGEKVTYPDHLQATERRIEASGSAQMNNAAGSYGGVAPGTSAQ